jgi:hypothetical protein
MSENEKVTRSGQGVCAGEGPRAILLGRKGTMGSSAWDASRTQAIQQRLGEGEGGVKE